MDFCQLTWEWELRDKESFSRKRRKDAECLQVKIEVNDIGSQSFKILSCPSDSTPTSQFTTVQESIKSIWKNNNSWHRLLPFNLYQLHDTKHSIMCGCSVVYGKGKLVVCGEIHKTLTLMYEAYHFTHFHQCLNLASHCIQLDAVFSKSWSSESSFLTSASVMCEN